MSLKTVNVRMGEKGLSTKLCATLTVTGVPDIYIKEITLVPAKVIPSGVFTCKVVLGNRGTATGTKTVKFTLDTMDKGTETEIVPAGGSTTIEHPITAPATPNTYNVCAEIV